MHRREIFGKWSLLTNAHDKYKDIIPEKDKVDGQYIEANKSDELVIEGNANWWIFIIAKNV